LSIASIDALFSWSNLRSYVWYRETLDKELLYDYIDRSLMKFRLDQYDIKGFAKNIAVTNHERLGWKYFLDANVGLCNIKKNIYFISSWNDDDDKIKQSLEIRIV